MFFQPVRTMTATIAAEMGEVAQGTLHYNVLFGIGIVLFVITFAINSLANRLVGFDGGSRDARRQAMKRQQTHRLAVTLFTIVAAIVVIPIVLVIVYVFWQGPPGAQLGISDAAALQRHDRGRHHAGHRRDHHSHLRHGHRLHAAGDCRGHLPGRVCHGQPADTRMIRLSIVNLAGIPSIVYGLFGLGAFVLFMGFGTSILAGSLTLGIMTLPVVITTAEEAILSVPQQFRTVSLSLGATHWQTIRHQVLPHACPASSPG